MNTCSNRVFGVALFLAISLLVFAQPEVAENDAIRYQLQAARRAMRAKNYTAAVEILRPLAVQGNGWAEHYLGISYYFGDGVGRDFGEARRWFSQAADQGIAPAQYYMGVIYAEGDGVKRDDVEAARWFQKSADQNYVPSQAFLGWAYAHGVGVLLDPAVALMWYKRAAETGHERASYELGEIYLTGWGVKKDLVEGYKWLAISAGCGSEEGKQAMESAKTLLSPRQLKQATIAARDWFMKDGSLTRPVDELLTIPQ